MPITTSATQTLRKDRRRTIVNLRRKRATKRSIDAVKAKPSTQKYSQASSLIDRLAKYHLIHKNKAARLKSQLSKLLATPR